MKFSIDKHEQYVVLALDELEFTSDITKDLDSELISLSAEGFRNIVVDLSTVKKCSDSQDLTSLMVGHKVCKAANGIFIVCGVSSQMEEIVKMSKLRQTITFVNKLEEATDLIFMEEIEKELRGEV